MGRRARRGGIANRALRAARAAAADRDEQAAEVAQRVYGTAARLRDAMPPGEAPPLPLHILAPVQTAAELAAPGAAYVAGLDFRDEAVVREVAAYLVDGFRSMVFEVNPEHFQAWRERQDEAAPVAADDGPA